jgi:ELWxxDGT repeat protein
MAAQVWAETLESRVLLSGGPRVTFFTLRPGAEIFNIDSGSWQVAAFFDRPVRPVNLAGVRVGPAGDPQGSTPASRWEYDHNESEVIFTFSRPLTTGAYEIRLVAGAGGIQGLDGAALDGELPNNAYPSGDLEAGGDLVVPFTTRPFTNAGIEPKELIAWPVSDHEIELQWQGDVNYNYGFEIARAAGDGDFEIINRNNLSGYGTFGYVDTAAAPGQVYRYRIRSWGFEDDVPTTSGWSNETSSTVLPPDLYFPISTLPAQALAQARPDWLTDVDGTVFFTLSAGPHPTNWRDGAGVELWKTDGTGDGTERLASVPARDLTNFNGRLFFAGRDAEAGEELWKSDGTPQGTVRVADVVPGPASSSPRVLGVMGGRLFFAVPAAGQSYEVWKTDGTGPGTVKATDRLMYLDQIPDTSRDFRRLFAFSGGRLYFRRADEAGNDTQELWRTGGDGGIGASDQAEQVAGIIDPSWLTDFKGQLFLAADVDALHPRSRGFWKVVEEPAAAGGTGAAGELVTATNTFGPDYGNLAYLTVVGDYMLFCGETQNTGNQLYRSDGTAAGTEVLGRVNRTIGGDDIRQYDIVDAGGGIAYFFGSDYPPSLFKTDGTVAGTEAVRRYDFIYSLPTHSPAFLLPVSGRVVYSDARDLWYSNGTAKGSYKIAAVGPEAPEGGGTFGFAGKAALVVGDNVFFSTRLADGRRELRVASLTPPAAPGALTATPLSPAAEAGVAPAAAPAGVRLTWNDRSGNESGFAIERSTRADFATVGRIFYSAADATEFLDASAEPGTTYYYRARAVNAGGASAYSNTAVNSLPFAKVTQVFVNGPNLTNNNVWRVSAGADSAFGYPLADGAGQLRPIPWNNGINAVSIRFSTDVASSLSQADLSVRNSTGTLGTTGFAYDPATRTATWTLDSGITLGKLRLVIPSAGVIGLDGEWDNGNDTYPSGNDVYGGDFDFRVNVLRGDANGDGVVNALDVADVKKRLLRRPGEGPYSSTDYTIFADVIPDGVINALDIAGVKLRLNQRLSVLAEPTSLLQ